MAISIKKPPFSLLVYIVLFCLGYFTALGQEPEWWTKQKRDCGLPANLAYNSWDGSCPAQNSNNKSGTPDNSEAERQRKLEEERQRKKAEQRRLAAEAEAKRIADQKVFDQKRDDAAGKLKGSGGSSRVPTGSGTTTIKGSSSNTGIKTGNSVPKSPPFRESEFFYALQTRKFEPLGDGGHPIDSPVAKPNLGVHGLVGGTSWTYGFKWPRKACDKACRDEMITRICATNLDLKDCNENTLPFAAEDYDMVVSMGSYHDFFTDLVTRVVFDGPTLGEFTKQHKEVFASLAGREFDTLDCHSNGAMLCLAALRGGLTKAKVVRLFGPQINPAAAAQWKALAAKGVKVEIYINNGDPVPGLSWKMPMTKPLSRPAIIPAWAPTVATSLLSLPDAFKNAIKDSETSSMDVELAVYGFKVNRLKCSSRFNFNCHSMREYEGNIK